MKPKFATFGGPGFQWRKRSHSQDLGPLWSAGFCPNEGQQLTQITLAKPGSIFETIENPNEHLLMEIPDPVLLQSQFECLVNCYKNLGITVHQLPESKK